MVLLPQIRFKQRSWRGRRVKVPRPVKARFDDVCSDLSSFIHLNPFKMQTSNGQSAGLNSHSVNTTVDTRNVSKNVEVSLTPSQAEFIDFVLFHGVEELSRSLRMIHDLALYHSDVCFEEAEKVALFDLKLLWEGLERIEEKD